MQPGQPMAGGVAAEAVELPSPTYAGDDYRSQRKNDKLGAAGEFRLEIR